MTAPTVLTRAAAARSTTAPAGLQLRDATETDNAALIDLTTACPMNGEISLRMDRSPDFFALNRLEGDPARVGVATDAAGRIVGCVAVARRSSYLNGEESAVAYVSDLKVHPSARGSGAADLLTGYARQVSRELCGNDATMLCTILAGNAPMERRARGPRGAPILSRFATSTVLAIPLLWRRAACVNGVTVRAAGDRDVERMASAWDTFARRRQFAPVMTAETMQQWISAAPGLSIADYLIATDGRGAVLGFVGIWDQRTFKQLRVMDYSRGLARARRAINAVSPLIGLPPLPAPGECLPALAAVHLCADSPATARALLLEAYRRHRGGRFAFLTLGLDTRDELVAATRGLLAQPTLVHAYVTSPRGVADPRELARLPFHHESALV